MGGILYSLVEGGLLGAGLLVCLYLFLSAKRETCRAALRAERSRQAIEDEIDALKRAVEHVRDELRELVDRSSKLVEPPPAASGLNLTKRSQALRMHRQGSVPEKIAAALLMPRQEVELLLKIEELAAEKS